MQTPLFLVQARIGSTRLPRKVLMDLERGVPLIDCVLDRIRACRCASPDGIVVLTTESERDLPLAEHLERNRVPIFRGSENDVFGRFLSYLESCVKRTPYFFRICADNPFLEPTFIDAIANRIGLDEREYDYISYATRDGTPAIRTHYGMFGELVRTDAFLQASRLPLDDQQREHVTPIFYAGGRFRTFYLSMPDRLERSGARLTIDTEEDLHIAQELLARLPHHFGYEDILTALEGDLSMRERMSVAISRNRK